MIKIISLSIAFIIFTAVIILFIIGGFFFKPHYLEPWQHSYSNKFDDPRIKLSAHGLLAANAHNMQPWKIKLNSNKNIFYLFADSTRLVKGVDPFARQTMISQGAFLEYVRIAGEKSGYKTDITLFPYGEYDEQNLLNSIKNKPVAKITLTMVTPQENSYYEYMFLSDTNRGAYQKQELTSDEVEQFLSLNHDINIKIKIFQNDENKKTLGKYILEGAKIESSLSRISKETSNIFRANEYEKNKFKYGFSVEGQGITGINKYFTQGLLTLFPSISNEKNSAELYIKSTQTAVDFTPTYGFIITTNNSRIEQVKSGMLYSRLVLHAHSLGVVMQPLSQVLQEYPEMEEQYIKIHKDYVPNGGTIQMLFRIGRPLKEFPQSMRRDIMDLVDYH